MSDFKYYANIRQLKDLTIGEKITLSCIVDDCMRDSDGKCYYTYVQIAQKTGLANGTVQKDVCSLVDKGYLLKDKTSVGCKRYQNVYRLSDKVGIEMSIPQCMF